RRDESARPGAAQLSRAASRVRRTAAGRDRRGRGRDRSAHSRVGRMSATSSAPAAVITKPDGLHMLERVNAAASASRAQWSETPVAAIILGTGLGRLAEQIEKATAI